MDAREEDSRLLVAPETPVGPPGTCFVSAGFKNGTKMQMGIYK